MAKIGLVSPAEAEEGYLTEMEWEEAARSYVCPIPQCAARIGRPCNGDWPVRNGSRLPASVVGVPVDRTNPYAIYWRYSHTARVRLAIRDGHRPPLPGETMEDNLRCMAQYSSLDRSNATQAPA